ncbi:hypothetical protein [Motilimonas cestriensis]|uniref:hypothetical protein n=1 Tax=Motilimonas cestriensis TaxID=2742685 RepID=UPI003DA39F5F
MFKSDFDARAELFCYATINLRSDEMTANWLAKFNRTTTHLPIRPSGYHETYGKSHCTIKANARTGEV